MRMNNRNKQPIWYALYTETKEEYDEYGNAYGYGYQPTGNQVSTYADYANPVQIMANVSPAKGNVMAREFGDDDLYDKVIAVEEPDTPINEYAVLWIDTVPELDATGALKVNANGEIVTPWDYIVRKVARSLPTFGCTLISVSKVSVK